MTASRADGRGAEGSRISAANRAVLVAGVLLLLAVITMIAPTYHTEWLGEDPSTTTVSLHSWAAPLLLGYNFVFPMGALVLAALGLLCTICRVWFGDGVVGALVCSTGSLVFVGVCGFVFDGVRGVGVLVPAALVSAIVALVIARLRDRAAQKQPVTS